MIIVPIKEGENMFYRHTREDGRRSKITPAFIVGLVTMLVALALPAPAKGGSDRRNAR